MSSPSSSDSEESATSATNEDTGVSAGEADLTAHDTPAKTKVVAPEQAFQDFYLRQATLEFANDLDKLRSASDFNAKKSIGLLVDALKQGEACFSLEERVKVGGGKAD